MKRVTIGLLAACFLFASSVMASEVRIGFLATFTGPAGAIGKDMRDAFELGLDQLGHKMDGLKVKMFYADDTFKPGVGKQKVDKMVKADRVHFVTGHIWSHVLLASYKSVVGKGPFLISANAGPSPVAGKLCHEDFFSTSWQNDQTPMAMGEVMNQLGIKTAYILGPNYAAGKNMLSGFRRTYKGKLVGEDLTPLSQTDFSAELAKIRSRNPEAVFIFYPGKWGPPFFKQYKQAGLSGKIPLYSAFSVDALNANKLKGLIDGSYGTQFWVPDLDNAANRRFVSTFKKKYGRFPSFYAAQAYDTVFFINSAIVAVKGDHSNKDGMRAEMKRANYNSVRGKYRYGNNNFPIQNFYLRQAYKNADGVYTFRTIRTVLRDHQDPYAKFCKM